MTRMPGGGDGRAGTVRVSVVVAVYNPGAEFNELIGSLDRQTLRARHFEVLLCDDGSDEPTRQRLARVARTRPNVRVLSLEHTGWPGTPRNRGIEAARGDYVYIVDQDDWLFERALARLCDYADRNGSDVVIGKEVGIGRRIPGQIFRRDIPHAVLGEDPLLELLTPHKLFRTAFLRDNDIRFPDGRVRLEDHLFVMRAYFAAKTISILASEPCYAWVKNRGSASSSRIDPVTYFPHLETVLDLVEANTPPGALRNTLLRHWYRGKILKRLDGRRVVKYPDDYRERFLDVVIPIARERFGPGVEAGLPFPLRVRSALLRAGRRDELLRLAEFEAKLGCRAEVTAAQWTPGGKLKLTLRIRFLRDGQDALVFDPREVRADAGAGAGDGVDAGAPAEEGPRVVWRPPESLGLDVLPEADRDASRDLWQDRVDLFLREDGGSERRIRGSRQRNMARATVTIDPLESAAVGDASVVGQLVARVRHAGWTFETPLRADPAIFDGMKPSPLLAGRNCELGVRSDGTVEFRRDGSAGRLRDFVARAARRPRAIAGKVVPARIRRALSRVRGG
ncbi:MULTISPECIES: glycosyltransferase family A protein [unclassified Microbacterium]|uniref:glycosyltransferase family 2 protein n=1 Tax=unclassified Microbacterium TaxID=2609290 RepID=UPI00214C28D8|nr:MULTISPECIES: glycosyltransferase family A protein [unclassified Microbacterium]MCR2783021.1 glycosyltransferase family 2 protein [Microbacterium sp. zg.B96]WIM16093.1 glycosyltransferase family A protein [Microbacterium sp. zg-B96]